MTFVDQRIRYPVAGFLVFVLVLARGSALALGFCPVSRHSLSEIP